ncbi:alpha/beta fold hydrolase [Bdellovibrio sp. HCB274]|uniref:alpha/beta fold hydrolase n=1 Tax=Bdellovibrio sp. HCB274 TaxID=3394361 RepID=UPI0039B48C13
MNNSQNLPLVMLPGFLCDPRLWGDVLANLPPGDDIILIDFKHCKSLQDMVGQLEKLETSRFHLVGFSMGAYIAKIFATKFPERVASLTLVATNVGALSEREQTSRSKLAGMLANVQYKGMNEKEAQRFIHSSSAQNPHVVQTIVEMSRSYTSEMYIAQMRATLHREDLSAEIAKLSFPVLIVAGKDDHVVRLPTLQHLHEVVARSKILILDQCGHYVPLEKAKELSVAIHEFVNSGGA